ncbi:MAG: hypothetical protein WBE38_18465 [Terracidiphilus sp.]
MSMQGLELFNLLPAVYRVRDAQLAQAQTLLTPAEQAELAALQSAPSPLSADEQTQLNELTAKASRGPLQSLLMVIQEQLKVVAYDLDQLYDDQFIETCAQWVIPYIGDLIGYESIKGIAPSVDNPRSEVANTISFRRRKGTVLVMEQLARDATGWSAHAVEFFRVLGDAQYMNHVRPENHYAPDLRRWQPGLYIDTGFDRTSHRVDVRRVDTTIPLEQGRYNIQNIGIFLWSMSAFSVTQGTPAAMTANVADQPLCYTFNPLGMDIPLFHTAVSQGADITAPAQPFNVADRLRRRVLCADLQQGVGASYYGVGNSVVVWLGGKPLNPYQIRVCDLAAPDGSWINLPQTNAYAATIDPESGRIALPASSAATADITVSYQYGFNAPMGGGEYERAADPNGFVVTDEAWVFPYPDTAAVARYNSLQGAIDYAIGQLALNGQAAVEIGPTQTIAISGTPPLTPALAIDVPAGATLELRAADNALATIFIDQEIVVTGGASSTCILNGLQIAGAMTPASPSPAALVHVPALHTDGIPNALGQLSVTNCTLVPGWSVQIDGTPDSPDAPALIAEPAGLQVAVKLSITGAIEAGEFVTVNACDAIIDATANTGVAYTSPNGANNGAGGALTLVGCTVIGKVHATELALVSDCIFWSKLSAGDTWAAPLIADRKQAGCVRFSFLPVGAITPRQFQCVEQALASAQPIFFSLRYGAPGYAKLLTATSDAVRRGAHDGGEMGAFHFVLAPLREDDLRIRMQEYLPVGMEFGIIYQN